MLILNKYVDYTCMEECVFALFYLIVLKFSTCKKSKNPIE